MSTTLAGKTILVTGATSGIGLATAEGLVRQGTDVIGVGRSISRCQTAEQRLAGLNSAVQVTYITADLTLQSEVRRLAREIPKILAARGRTALDGLVNNAGAFTYWLALTPEGFETQWAVNYLAPFLLTNELLPLLQAAPRARIVTVSSESHYNTSLNWTDIQLRRHYNGLLAYKQTKLADVLFTAELNRRLGPHSHVRAFAADPGLVNTEIGAEGHTRPGALVLGTASGRRNPARRGCARRHLPARGNFDSKLTGVLLETREPAAAQPAGA